MLLTIWALIKVLKEDGKLQGKKVSDLEVSPFLIKHKSFLHVLNREILLLKNSQDSLIQHVSAFKNINEICIVFGGIRVQRADAILWKKSLNSKFIA